MAAYSYTYRSEVSERAAAYCDRCRRGFKTERGLALHLQDSRRHWECPTCDHDADGWDGLLDHCRETNCRSVCEGCDDGQGEHWPFDSDEFWQHFEDENACTDSRLSEYSGSDDDEDEGYGTPSSDDDDCGTEGYEADGADSEDSPDTEECLKCDRHFTTYGGMILHLESGSCSYVDEKRLNMLAAGCRKSQEFVMGNMRTYIDADYYDLTDYELYFCPVCDSSFHKLSGLFQHVESPACDQELYEGAIGTLQRYLDAYIDS